MKSLIRDLTPPLVWRSLASISRNHKQHWKQWKAKYDFGVEQGAEFYDDAYENIASYKTHYTTSGYYPTWTVIMDRMMRHNVESVLDVGCGPGQMACLMRDCGVKSYIGIDFSAVCVDMARNACPEYSFYCADVFTTDLFDSQDYDCVTILEVLEHVEEDLSVLKSVKSGKRVIASVPSFNSKGHVRQFSSVKEVQDRYSHLLERASVTPIRQDEQGSIIFILEGVRN